MVKQRKNFSRHSDNVYVTDNAVTTISQADVEFLSRQAISTQNRKARVLLHGDPKEDLHEMLIVHSLGQYIRPHINDRSAKSFLVVNGEMIVVMYNKGGDIRDHIRLGGLNSNSDFLLRLNDPVFHTIVPISNTVTFLETVKGPHKETHYAPFAPSPKDTSGAEKYMDWLMKELRIN